MHLHYFKLIQPSGHPFHHFGIRDYEGATVGHINLRIGHTQHIMLYAGHLGYVVEENFRGNAFADHACRPIAKNHYGELVLTVKVGNVASIRTVEKLGGTYQGRAAVPNDGPGYQSGARRKLRYTWTPS